MHQRQSADQDDHLFEVSRDFLVKDGLDCPLPIFLFLFGNNALTLPPSFVVYTRIPFDKFDLVEYSTCSLTRI